MRIPLNKIDLDQSIDVRDEKSSQCIEEYTEHLKTPGSVPLPPVVVFGPDSRGMYFLSEGWHRLTAHQKAGKTSIEAVVKPGGWIDAQDYATSKNRSNIKHGWRETRDQKKRILELTIKRHPDWSNERIAEHCGMSRPTVIEARSNLSNLGETLQVESRVGRDGRTRAIPPVPTRKPQQKPSSETPATPPEKPKGPPLPVDPAGRTILPHLVGLWAGRDTLKGMASRIAQVRREIEQAFDDRDPLFCGQEQGVAPVERQGLLAALKRAEGELKAAIPWGVCGMCNGTGCRACSGNGLVTEVQRDRMAPEYR